MATGGGKRFMEVVSDLVMGGAFLGGFGVPGRFLSFISCHASDESAV